MIQVFLSINNNEEVIQLPVPPAGYEVPSPWNNEKLEGLQGTVNIIGLRDLRSVEIQSFFPAQGHDYPFLQNRAMWGMEYVNAIERWRERRAPIRLVIVDSSSKKNINMPVTIDNFTHSMRRDGDIYFTLEMTEFTFVSTKKR
ncbi:hypothetical protein [Paenibacillus thermotolerans]|uniref:hypothetical protein n=1 Tax=Paenibacillus thermotolerans TaxID=3027807 RepID=UPI0023679F3F|nr:MULTISPECIES: hypothetical protein [unclassified Paenibacillus]